MLRVTPTMTTAGRVDKEDSTGEKVASFIIYRSDRQIEVFGQNPDPAEVDFCVDRDFCVVGCGCGPCGRLPI